MEIAMESRQKSDRLSTVDIFGARHRVDLSHILLRLQSIVFISTQFAAPHFKNAYKPCIQKTNLYSEMFG